MTLSGKTALVTGGTRGIGFAIAKALAAEGARVAICHPGDPRAGRAEAELSALGPAFAFTADVSVEADVVAFFDAVEERLGSPDIVVANAGILREAPITEMPVEQFDRVIAVNLRGSFLTTREAARRMGAAKTKAGRIITIASDLAHLGREGLSAYAASKGGVVSLTRSLARELAPAILVNAIAPGSTVTDMTSPENMSPEALAKDLDTPLGRFGTPEEIAAMAVFLAGPGAGFITGQVFGVNGGSAMT
ncbi:MAG: 3-oxoacyl-ACP reductase FabG [Thioclava marina]|uniref:SDR family NAD(P)-dependent oxidoreductase n=1 Tax=Thioclava marina TaxID=1915077 RepID=UPI0019A73E9C|nr:MULTISPECIES: 3-oxoacyl-ACP reductase family protein [Thioclava]MBC7145546.1 3-oxoacyl-ACP reductase FabG [Thioclava marina]MBD3802920.1 3-oxoacyl-ACP reductase FabG [Thioclava sp.]TNF12477.1 MAG: 3-oxoacyl-ACP reductase FabG [Paracoccaceae bacterium]